MSTLVLLKAEGLLDRWEPALRASEQALRGIYLYPRATRWLTEDLPGLEPSWNLEVDPAEELDAFANQFFIGAKIVFQRQVKPLRHIDSGVWELKTSELRLFGWFAVRDVFVCSAVDTATRVKTYSLYAGYRDQAVRDRDELDLDQPKFVSGEEIENVLSNCD